MPKLSKTLLDCDSDSLPQALKGEIEGMAPGTLPLAQGTTQGGYVDDHDISATIISVAEKDESIQARVGIFFSEIVAGCSCGDPPVSETAYCEIQVSIDMRTGEAEFTVI
jgi:hypothetical protein